MKQAQRQAGSLGRPTRRRGPAGCFGGDRRRCFVFAVLLLCSWLGWSHPVAAAPAPATAAEAAWMAKLLTRLDANAEAMPVQVSNTRNSLSRNVSWAFSCPEATRFDEVEIQISTEHVNWNPSRLRRRPATGGYGWKTHLKALGGRARVIAENWIMLDTGYLDRAEAEGGAEGMVETEATLYHELLHGEIVVLAMATPEWQRKVCNKLLDLHHFAPSHDKIEPLAAEYARRRREALDPRVADGEGVAR